MNNAAATKRVFSGAGIVLALAAVMSAVAPEEDRGCFEILQTSPSVHCTYYRDYDIDRMPATGCWSKGASTR